jgi:hypothetical protein
MYLPNWLAFGGAWCIDQPISSGEIGGVHTIDDLTFQRSWVTHVLYLEPWRMSPRESPVLGVRGWGYAMAIWEEAR